MRRIRSSLRMSDSTRRNESSSCSSPREENQQQVWSTQVAESPPTLQCTTNNHDTEPYIPPVDYIGESSTSDPPPIYSTLDPLTRQKVLKMLQRAGIRRSLNSSIRGSLRRSQARRHEENVLVTQPPATLELQGLDHLAFDHEMV